MMEDQAYVQNMIAQYKAEIMPLLVYLDWLEKHSGQSVSTMYRSPEMNQATLAIPVYDSTLMNFVKEATKSSLMKKDYQYVYSRHHLVTHEDERKLIASADFKEWDLLRGILSKYILGGRVKGTWWNEAVQEGIFYLVLKRMREIVEFWDQPLKL